MDSAIVEVEFFRSIFHIPSEASIFHATPCYSATHRTKSIQYRNNKFPPMKNCHKSPSIKTIINDCFLLSLHVVFNLHEIYFCVWLIRFVAFSLHLSLPKNFHRWRKRSDVQSVVPFHAHRSSISPSSIIREPEFKTIFSTLFPFQFHHPIGRYEGKEEETEWKRATENKGIFVSSTRYI